MAGEIVGRPLTLATTGSNQLVLARDTKLLGFFVTAAATVSINDAATVAAAAAGNLVLPTTAALPVGWYPFPVALNNGLVANISVAGVVFVVA